MLPNTLYHGDCLEVTEDWPKASIDLIYLDPPFNSNRVYYMAGSKDVAFEDKWQWDEYLEFMRVRLVRLHGLLKPTGSLYLHCDPTVSHYLKVELDKIFGRKNFRNEIVWCYKENETATRYFPRKHDIILSFSRSNKYVFSVLRGQTTEAQKKRYNHIIDGERYANMKGKMRKLKGGAKIRDWWPMPISQSCERTGYPTQKPEALLERIIKASSNPGDIVLDPFCGSGTTCAVAKQLGRRYIGIDVSDKAIEIAETRCAS